MRFFMRQLISTLTPVVHWIGKKQGRYDAMTSEKFLEYIKSCTERGLTEAQIARHLDFKPVELRAIRYYLRKR